MKTARWQEHLKYLTMRTNRSGLRITTCLTAKPTIYAANVAEDDLADDGASNPHVAKVREMAKEEGAEVFVICAQIEQELADLDDDEKKEYLEDLGVSSSGLDKLVAASYSLLGTDQFPYCRRR